jgi:hypothetical protein
MTKKYHVKFAHNKEEVNFLTLDEVHELAQNGAIKPYDHIKGEGNKTWHKASTVKGLSFKNQKMIASTPEQKMSASMAELEQRLNDVGLKDLKSPLKSPIGCITVGVIIFMVSLVMLGIFDSPSSKRTDISGDSYSSKNPTASEVYGFCAYFYLLFVEENGREPSDSETFGAAAERFGISPAKAKQLFWKFEDSQP